MPVRQPRAAQPASGKGAYPVKEGLQGLFAIDRIAKEQRQKVERLVPTKAPSNEADVGVERIKKSLTAQVASDEGDLSKP